MNKTIQISECTTTVEEIQKLGLREIGCMWLTKTSGYPCIIIGDLMYYDKEFEKDKPLKVLVNDRAPLPNSSASTSVTLEIPDNKSNSSMPSFGVTVSNNFSIVQVNVSMDSMKSYFENSIINYWKPDQKFYTGERTLSVEDMQTLINEIAAYGYRQSVLVVCDVMLKPSYYTHIYNIYQIMGKIELPVKVMCFRDYNYLNRLCLPLYNAVNTVPENLYYNPENGRDYTDMFIWNYSDKRDVFDQYKERGIYIPNDDSYRVFNRESWKPDYYLLKERDWENRELIQGLKKYDVNTMLGTSMFQEDTPDAFYASAYLKGYERLLDVEDRQSWETLTLSSINDFEVYASSNTLDTALIPWKRLSYHYDQENEFHELLKHFDADIIVSGDRNSCIIGYNNIHQLLNKETIKIKYVRRKR